MPIRLYWCPNTRAVRALWLLEEIGAKYEIARIDVRKGEQSDPAFRAISPLGKVPALVDGETVVAESGAICVYLGDRFPEAKLAPPMSSPLRGPYLRWLFFAAACIEPAFADRALSREGQIPHLSASWGSFDSVAKAMRDGLTRGPWLLGDAFSTADILMGSGVQWGVQTKLLPDDNVFGGYMRRLAARPALQRTLAIEAKG